MRLALLTYSTKPRGGVVHTLALAEALAERGHDVTVWSVARGGDVGFFRAVDPRVTIRLAPFTDIEGETVGQRVLRSIAALRTALASAPAYDLVHAQDCISANAVGPGCVRTVHHLDTFTTPELIACHDRALRDPRAHICVSSAVAAELARDFGITATVIPNGVDAARFAAAALPVASDERDAWHADLGLQLPGKPMASGSAAPSTQSPGKPMASGSAAPSTQYVLAVGGIEPRKGTADLIEAIALLNSGRRSAAQPPLPLVIAGGETLFDYRDYRTHVLARAAELDIPLRLLGTVADDRLPALVAGASVLAFPSLAEGFGLAAMEALAAGVPLVCRDLPVLREIFDGAALFASTPAGLAEALTSAVETPAPARVDAGRSLAASHTWAAAAEAHEMLYLSLLG